MFSKDFLYEEATYQLNKIVEIENKIDGKELIYKTGNKKNDKTNDFQKFKTIRLFVREIYNNNLSLDGASKFQIILKDDIDIFKELTKPKESFKKEKSTNS